jgi:putative hemolysin
MTTGLTVALLGAASFSSFLFSALTYSLREYSRPKLSDYLERHDLERWFDWINDHIDDLVIVTAVLRLFSNALVLVFVLHLFEPTGYDTWLQYLLALLVTGLITFFCSVTIPHAISRHAAEKFIALFIRPLYAMRLLLLPATRLMRGIDHIVGNAVGGNGNGAPDQKEEEIEQEILSVVEEGAKEGLVDEQEREMIESVIEFRDTNVGQIMTARPDIVALEVTASLDKVKALLEQSGHSRVPVYEGNLDHIVGILYARDLLKHVGEPPERFDLRSILRPALYVPESKPLGDLLQDFRLQKIHIAMVLDEYGGTAGLVTIEDVLEELVGEISDEHEPAEPAMLSRIDELSAEADARIYIDELNRLLGLNIPEDAGYDTLGGFISTMLGRIPESGATFEHGEARYTILAAEPHRVIRVKIDLIPQPVPGDESE